MPLADIIFQFRAVKAVWYFCLHAFSGSRSSLTHTSPQPRVLVWGTRAPHEAQQHVPRLIWSFWQGSTSCTAEACQESWREHTAGFTVHVLTPQSVKEFLPDFPNLPSDVPAQKVSNLVRLMLLSRYGGIWIDYSTIITSSLDWVIYHLRDSKCELLGFYNEFRGEYRKNHKRPIIENGFLASIPQSKFVSQWTLLYKKCLLSENRSTYFEKRDDYDKLITNFVKQDKDYLRYFICYISAQAVMLKSTAYKLFLINAEDNYYRHYYSVSPPRNIRKFAEELLLKSTNHVSMPSLVKIPGGHRAAIDDHIAHGCWRKNSVLGQYLYRWRKSQSHPTNKPLGTHSSR